MSKHDEATALVEMQKVLQKPSGNFLVDGSLRKGDVPGHEFHGNQYASGSGGGSTEGSKAGSEQKKTAYTTIHSDKTRAKLEAAGIKTSHIGKNRPLIDQRRMLSELAEKHGIEPVYR